ncbi:hypothetical protein DY000_02042652 [Brassica cretica]|uniref:Uncharacterized protein n=1 Tax=Brassica cretica TaxID=69181 RepID=A0ABQ7BM23_BRACR|nr:hypothetical protein DY000_02042652 [Brassica cretica]
MPPAWRSPSRLHGLKRICTYRIFFAIHRYSISTEDVNSRPELDLRRDGFVVFGLSFNFYDGKSQLEQENGKVNLAIVEKHDRLVGKKLISTPMRLMSYKEFDNLKEELMWEGSSFVMLSSSEQKFLEASVSYVCGNPIINGRKRNCVGRSKMQFRSNEKVKVIRRMSTEVSLFGFLIMLVYSDLP